MKLVYKFDVGNNIALALVVFGVICACIWVIKHKYPGVNTWITKIMKWRPWKRKKD